MKLSTLYKRSTTGKVSEWTIEVEGNKFRTISGFTDGEKVTSAWTECIGKNKGKSNSTDANKQALQQAKSLHKKRIEHGSFDDANDIDNEVYFKPMLAQDLKDRIDEIKFPVYSQPKLDGVRCIAKVDGLFTRNGKKLLSSPHIFKALKPLFEVDPELILDGELYCDKLANDFDTLISLVRKTKPTLEDLVESAKYIEYHIYDIPSAEGSFVERAKFLDNLYLGITPLLGKVVTYTINRIEEIKFYFEKYIEMGYEGQIIRVDGPYEHKRSKYLLKDKEFITEEFTIMGVEEGKGNMKGKVGKLYFEKNGESFDSSVNGTWGYLEELLKRNDLIGKPATIKYFNLTPRGVPRFGKVIAIRDYEG